MNLAKKNTHVHTIIELSIHKSILPIDTYKKDVDEITPHDLKCD